MKLFGVITVVLMALLLTGNPPCFSEELKIGAGAAPAENILKPIKSAFEKATNIQLIIIDSGPKVALADLKRANLDAAAAGLSFQEWVSLMEKEGVAIDNPSLFRPVTFGQDRIVVITHKDNPIKKLTSEQLRAIFSGETDNWKSVGGPDIPIIIVWGTLMQDDNKLFLDRFLGGKPMATELLDTTTAEEVRQNVAANPSAIGIGPTGIVDESVFSPETPELSREITLVTRAYPPAAVQKLLDFIKAEGKAYVKQ